MQRRRQLRRRSPREDKDLDYQRQAVSGSAHGFRQHWPQRKASLHRRSRTAQTAALTQARALTDAADADSIEQRLAGSRRRGERNWNQENLGDHVTITVADRALDMIDSYAQAEYRPANQSAPMIRVLRILVRHRPAYRPVNGRLRSIAYAFDDMLPEPIFGRRSFDTAIDVRRRVWFAAFLDDEPRWEPQLRSWIAEVLA
jgi:hypothetical protein